MILRMWRGRAAPEKAGDYVQHARQKLFPTLRQIEGQRGAYLLRRAVDGAIEFVVITLWASMAAIARFAGPEPQKAIVEPEAQAILSSYDESATHFEIVHSTEAQEP
jgi:heme-degrading monooxygenase HmoA